MKRLAILGASGHGKVVADSALAAGWGAITFFDDRTVAARFHGEWPIVGDTACLISQLGKFDGVIVAIGDCRARAEKHALLQSLRAPLAMLVHPRAWVSSRCNIGAGSFIAAGAMVNIDAVLGEACIVNTGATIDHDCKIGLAVHVSPGANISGGVSIGDLSWIGVGAAVRHGIRIGSEAIVGAGSVVVSDVENGTTVFGSPAKPYLLVSKEEGKC